MTRKTTDPASKLPDNTDIANDLFFGNKLATENRGIKLELAAVPTHRIAGR
jgi:hypothetical protein